MSLTPEQIEQKTLAQEGQINNHEQRISKAEEKLKTIPDPVDPNWAQNLWAWLVSFFGAIFGWIFSGTRGIIATSVLASSLTTAGGFLLIQGCNGPVNPPPTPIPTPVDPVVPTVLTNPNILLIYDSHKPADSTAKDQKVVKDWLESRTPKEASGQPGFRYFPASADPSKDLQVYQDMWKASLKTTLPWYVMTDGKKIVQGPWNNDNLLPTLKKYGGN